MDSTLPFLIQRNICHKILLVGTVVAFKNEGDTGICGVPGLMFFQCGDAVNKISTYGVAVISNLTVCDVCVFHPAVFGEMKLFAVLGFLV